MNNWNNVVRTPKSLWTSISWLTLAFVVFALPAHALVITRTSSPVFYVNISNVDPDLNSMYVSYQIQNHDGFDYPDLWVTIGNFLGGVVSLGTFEDNNVHLGALAAGETKTAFFYVRASGATTVDQSHTISVYNGLPSAPDTMQLASSNFSFTDVQETLQANANKVASVVYAPNPPVLGGTLTITVTGDTGVIGADRILSFSPATYENWRADAYELTGSVITFSGGNVGAYTNTLLIPSGSLAPRDTHYVAVYTFHTVGVTTTPTPVSSVGYIQSGNQIKHTDTSDFGFLPAIQSAVNNTVLTKSASPSRLPGGRTVTFTLQFTNTGNTETTLDRIVDVFPTGVSYVEGSSTFNGSPIGNPAISELTHTWVGTFHIPAGASRSLVLQATVPPNNGAYTNSAVAFIDDTQIDVTTMTTDNSPATAPVTVRNCLPTDTTFSSVLQGGKLYAFITNSYGLASVQGTMLRNCIIDGTAYGQGFEEGIDIGPVQVGIDTILPTGTTNLLLIVSKIDPGLSATVNIMVTDLCGLTKSVDPVLMGLKATTGEMDRQVSDGLRVAERYVEVGNGSPGLKSIYLIVNGRTFVLDNLATGETFTVDIGEALMGNNNTLVLEGYGDEGSSAEVTIYDSLSGELSHDRLRERQGGPVLEIRCEGDKVVLTWVSESGYEVQGREILAPEKNWEALSAAPEQNNGRWTVRVSSGSNLKVFRVRKP